MPGIGIINITKLLFLNTFFILLLVEILFTRTEKFTGKNIRKKFSLIRGTVD